MIGSAPERLLVVANETVGGRALIDAVRAHAEKGPVAVTVVCPQNRPRHGSVIYDDAVRAAAENRLKTTLAQLRQAGIEAHGAVMDPDPYSAVMDALGEYGADCIIISTHPETRSGWLRRDLVDRVRDATGLPVEHVVVDLDADREEATRTLVVANRTVGGESLIERLEAKAAEAPHRFIVIVPHGGEGADSAAARLADTLRRFEEAGLEATGQVMDPDPFTAVQNALQFYAVDEIVVSTFPEARSRWLRGDLVERVRSMTSKPVEHVVVGEGEEGAEAPASEPEEDAEAPASAHEEASA
ncbi:MAG: universal stress protein [Actinomycetota bacterium]|nr:universal stress protein [Actinomycetota bacterium]